MSAEDIFFCFRHIFYSTGNIIKYCATEIMTELIKLATATTGRTVVYLSLKFVTQSK